MKKINVTFIARFILTAFLVSGLIPAQAQIFDELEFVNTDSLKQLLGSQNKKQQLETYFRITKAYYVIQPDSCLKYALQSHEMAVSMDHPEMIAEADDILGNAYYYAGGYDHATEFLLKSAEYYASINDTASAFQSVAIIPLTYLYARNYDAVRQYIQEVEHSFVPFIKDTAQLNFIISGIGWFYCMMGQYERSNAYYDQFFEIAKIYPTSARLKAHFHRLTGRNFELMGDYRMALKSYLTAKKILEEINQPPFYEDLGSVYFRLDSLDQSIENYEKFLAGNDEKDHVLGFSIAYLDLGKIWSRKNQPARSEQYLRKALELAEWMYENKRFASDWKTDIESNYMTFQSVGKYREDQALRMIARIRNELYRLYDAQGLTSRALNEFIAYHEAVGALNNFEQLTAVEDIRNKYEADKKEEMIAALSQEKELDQLRIKQFRAMVIAFAGMFVLAVGLAIMFVRMIRIRSAQKSVMLEQKLLRSQMNPHFIFNALSNIANLVDKQDNEAASRFLNRFARLVRHILESTREDFILLDDELKNLENYLELQKLRFPDKFIYSVKVAEDIIVDEMSIPPMLVQPFVENAIEHGIKPLHEGGLLTVSFSMQEGLITCEVVDNGVGRQQSVSMEPMKHPHRSYGVAIARERLASMQRRLRRKVKLAIIDLRTDTGQAAGTRVIIDMPYKVAV